MENKQTLLALVKTASLLLGMAATSAAKSDDLSQSSIQALVDDLLASKDVENEDRRENSYRNAWNNSWKNGYYSRK